ncbi:putative transposase [Azorhizobium caulinodans ORS 571]|uniref:Putative transposase n=1 Tax=Azorhizobium caulinodans (strain ATCC 43989 / DSM 5975 / JCM 20966 / LMG 6465 / NBRC 14845 / NCIMB 13405 / ORS 571) TaxID=438753 RepID=A8IP16_AZOC5|nr:putative transposase [Azorhizobium caulinodans ORS 571]
MSQYPRLMIDTDVHVNFCDPQSPWQRGANETANVATTAGAGASSAATWYAREEGGHAARLCHRSRGLAVFGNWN